MIDLRDYEIKRVVVTQVDNKSAKKLYDKMMKCKSPPTISMKQFYALRESDVYTDISIRHDVRDKIQCCMNGKEFYIID